MNLYQPLDPSPTQTPDGLLWDNLSFVVPEPSTALLLASGLAALAVERRRRSR